jgi:BirA family transcriptional regulator, biotin operon repressor / biotin---[acetyl-CoA-carboxylase] ligase
LIAEECGWRVQRLGDVTSTNDEARKLCLQGDPGGLWVVAERQTAGRGRLDRRWVSPRGNLYASALLVDPCDAAQSAQIGFVAGVALIDALREIGGVGARSAGFALKWPNDVLIEGAKLAGVLVEGLTLTDRRFAAIVGVGVNCASAPDGLAYAATSLNQALGGEVAPAELFEALRGAFAVALRRWSRGAGFAEIRSAWLERASGLGARVSIKRGESAREGIFAGLDSLGRLKLERADGAVEFIEAGDFTLASA